MMAILLLLVLKEMINAYGEDVVNQVILKRNRFRPNWRKGHVLTKKCSTMYSPIYDKGLVDEQLDVYPYGYIGVAVSDPLRAAAKNSL